MERLVKIPVLNAACGAWGVDQIVLRVEQLAPTLKPALVIVGILDQDVLRNNYRMFGGGYNEKATGKQLRAERERVAAMLAHLSDADRAKVFGGTAAKVFKLG